MTITEQTCLRIAKRRMALSYSKTFGRLESKLAAINTLESISKALSSEGRSIKDWKYRAVRVTREVLK